jgi:hypothetical protein
MPLFPGRNELTDSSVAHIAGYSSDRRGSLQGLSLSLLESSRFWPCNAFILDREVTAD